MKCDRIRFMAAQVIIALSLCVMIYSQVKIFAPLNSHNRLTFTAYQLGLSYPMFSSVFGVMDQPF
jgi:hypothetical protein